MLALSGVARYEHFVKNLVDWEEAWDLYSDGWALAATDEGKPLFPLWPPSAYAQLCAEGDWVGYEPKPISLKTLTTELLPKLRVDGVLHGIFPTLSSKGVTPAIDEFLDAIDAELQKY